MTAVFMYADESGNLDYSPAGKAGATEYFGFGTAVFKDDHGQHLFDGLQLRAKLETKGVSLPRGFHAVDDSKHTKDEMFDVIRGQAPRFDTTFLLKSSAYPAVKQRGELYLYKMAWYLHFKEVALQISNANDDLYVVVGSIATSGRKAQAKAAIADVCSQVDRVIHLCHWDACTSWGLQVADYALWATHRSLMGRSCKWFIPSVQPTLQSVFTPWGRIT